MDASVQTESTSLGESVGLCSQCGHLTDLKVLIDRASSLASPSVDALVDTYSQTNDPLPSDARKEISSHVDFNLALLKQTEESIAQLSELLSGLKSVRDEVEIRVENSRSILHPIRILPNDCVSTIFTHCVTQPEGFDEYMNPTQSLPDSSKTSLWTEFMSWSLSQVSRHWRQVALASPEIWSHVSILICEPHDSTPWDISSLALLNLQLTRSASHPLNVAIRSNVIFSYFHPLFQGILFHSQRWKHLYVSLPPTSFTIFRQVYRILPQLQHLCVEYKQTLNETIDFDSLRAELDNFGSAPKLHSISIDANLLASQTSSNALPTLTRGITRYRVYPSRIVDMTSLYPATYLNALKHLPNLRSWSALCTYNSWHPSAQGLGLIMLDMKDLTSITLREDLTLNWSIGAMKQIMENLKAPALQQLSLEGDLNETCISSVVEFVERSECTLKKLTLVDAAENPGGTSLLPLLETASSLVELSLQYGSVWMSDADGDLLVNPGEALPPTLEILTLSDETELDQALLDGVKTARPLLKIRRAERITLR
jgi:hypothetical protein